MADKFLSEKQFSAPKIEAMRNWLRQLGPNHIARIKAIDALFEQRTVMISSACYADISTIRQEERDGSGAQDRWAARSHCGRLPENLDHKGTWICILHGEPELVQYGLP